LRLNGLKSEAAMKKKWIWIFFLILGLLILGTTQVSFAKDAVRLYFFYSEESGGEKVKEEFISLFRKSFLLRFNLFL